MDRLKMMYTQWKKSLKGEGMSQGKGGQAKRQGGKKANALCPSPQKGYPLSIHVSVSDKIQFVK